MEIKEKSITALIGPSGCGKSTFLKTLNRMNDLVDGVRIEGTIKIDGEDIYGRDIDTTLLRKKVGMVFQQPNPFPMSIYDNVAYGPRVHGIKDKKKLDKIVEDSLRGAAIWEEVKDRLKKSALSLSGGQQQRICIARALAVEPEILLMDEPFGAIDAKNRTILQELLLQLWEGDGTQEKKTVIFVTHDIDEAILLSDRIIMMSSHPGRVNQQISVPFERPRNRAELVQTREYSEFRNLLLSLFYSDIASKIGGDEVVL